MNCQPHLQAFWPELSPLTMRSRRICEVKYLHIRGTCPTESVLEHLKDTEWSVEEYIERAAMHFKTSAKRKV
jgi:hypothetical protein